MTKPSMISLLTFLLMTPVFAFGEMKVEGIEGSFKPLTDAESGFAKELVLKGSRRETLNFVLKFDGLTGCAPLQVRAADKKKKSDLDGLIFNFYRMDTIALAKKSYSSARTGEHFDPLLPLDARGVCAEKGPATTWVWGEVAIQESATPGDRKLVFEIGDKGSLPVSFRVWKMILPHEPSLKLYSEYAPYGGVIGHFGKWHESEGELASAYYRVMLQHGVVPLNAWIKVPEVREERGRRMDLDFSPNKKDSLNSILLNFMPSWAMVQFPGRLDLVPKPQRLKHFQAVENTIREKNLKNRSFIYLADEPKESEIAALTDAAKLIRKAAPDAKILVTTDYRSSLKDVIDIFVVPMNHLESKPIPKGVNAWWYVSCMSHGCDDGADSGFPDFVIERSTPYIRSIGWLADKAGVTNFLYYQMNYAYQFYPQKDPWKDQWAFTGNGDGTLFYPGRAGERGLQKHEPISSIRLKTWRETVNDHQYLKWVAESAASNKGVATWTGLLKEVEALRPAPDRFERSRSKYQTVRDRIGDALDGGTK